MTEVACSSAVALIGQSVLRNEAHYGVGARVHHEAKTVLGLLLDTVAVDELGRLTVIVNLAQLNDVNVVPEGLLCGFTLGSIGHRRDLLDFRLQTLVDAKPLTVTRSGQSSVGQTDDVDVLVEVVDASATVFLFLIVH